jgi:hypothetical protein
MQLLGHGVALGMLNIAIKCIEPILRRRSGATLFVALYMDFGEGDHVLMPVRFMPFVDI